LLPKEGSSTLGKGAATDTDCFVNKQKDPDFKARWPSPTPPLLARKKGREEEGEKKKKSEAI